MDVKSSTRYFNSEAFSPTFTWPHSLVDESRVIPLLQYRESTPNPRYKQIIKDEGNATTPLFAYSQSIKVSPGKVNIVYVDGTTRSDTHFSMIPISMPVSMLTGVNQSMLDEAVAKATAATYKRISEYQSPFNGQIFAGELREVIDLVKHPFAKSAKLTDTFLRTFSAKGATLEAVKQHGAKSSRIKNPAIAKIAKDIADLHLEYQFAVSPLISDVAKLINLATDIATKRDHETIRAYGKSERIDTYSSSCGGAGWTANMDEALYYKAENIIRCGMTARFIDSLRGNNNSNAWIDSVDDWSNLPITAYELLPFSFLVDYFVNVQDIIQSSIVSQTNLAYTSNSVIRTMEYRTKISSAPRNDRPDQILSVDLVLPKSILSSVRDVNRTGTLLGIPPVVFHLPGSNIRYANIAALLTKFLN